MTDAWDASAATFDDEADHGLRDPEVRAAWAALLVAVMPDPPARILDVGCGTGSLAVLLAQAGHEVTGIDTSAEMLALARAKAATAGVRVDLARADAADPPSHRRPSTSSSAGTCSGPCPTAMPCWPPGPACSAPAGRLVLVEGRWGTGVGLPADECRQLVLRHRGEADVRQLAPDPALWGRRVDDERYLLLSTR